MRTLFLLDQKIPQDAFDRVWQQVREIYKGLDIETRIERTNYKNITGAHKPTFDSLPYGFVKGKIDAIHKKNANRYDHIIFLVHKDNWVFQEKRVWGENFSYYFYEYQVELCRWDTNEANSVGTLYHEITHSHDALIEVELGVSIETVVGVSDWDKDVTHGGAPEWEYIRYKQNQDAIKLIIPLLKQAYEARKVRYLKGIYGQLNTIVELLRKVVFLQRKLKAKKNTSCQVNDTH